MSTLITKAPGFQTAASALDRATTKGPHESGRYEVEITQDNCLSRTFGRSGTAPSNMGLRVWVQGQGQSQYIEAKAPHGQRTTFGGDSVPVNVGTKSFSVQLFYRLGADFSDRGEVAVGEKHIVSVVNDPSSRLNGLMPVKTNVHVSFDPKTGLPSATYTDTYNRGASVRGKECLDDTADCVRATPRHLRDAASGALSLGSRAGHGTVQYGRVAASAALNAGSRLASGTSYYARVAGSKTPLVNRFVSHPNDSKTLTWGEYFFGKSKTN